MIRNVLVPTDFSDNAMKASCYAAEMAQKNGSTVILLHVIEPIEDHIRQPFILHEKYMQEVITRNRIELKNCRNTIADKYPELKIETALINGTVIASMLEFTAKHSIDLIIMGTKGASGLKQVFLGSKTAGFIERAEVPVMAIPEKYQREEPDAIVFATNKFEENTAWLDKIMEIAALFSAIVHIAVFVDEHNIDDYKDKTLRLHHYVEFLGEKYPEIRFQGKVLEGKDFEETIEQYDTQNQVDIIAMLTYHRGFWERFIKSSLTKKMAFHSRIPVLAIPAAS